MNKKGTVTTLGIAGILGVALWWSMTSNPPAKVNWIESKVEAVQQAEPIVVHDPPWVVHAQPKPTQEWVDVRVNGFTYRIELWKLCYHGLLPAEACS